jgi:hypothetical protein
MKVFNRMLGVKSERSVILRLKSMLKVQDTRLTGLNWFSIGTSGWLLWTR